MGHVDGVTRVRRPGRSTTSPRSAMAKRGFWTRERMLPGQSAVEETVETYWMLRLIHPPSALAMALGAIGAGYLGWKLFRDHGIVWGVLAAAVAAFVGAWLGLLLYWLLRLML